MIWAGGLADRFRVRALALVMMSTLALVCLAMSSVSALWMLPVIIFGLRFSGQGMISHIAVVAMARWYVAARGKAISVSSLGMSLGEACLPLIFVAILTPDNWRLLWVLAACISAAAIPALLWLLRTERVPSAVSDLAEAAGMSGRHWSRRDVLGDWRFWCLLPMTTCTSIFSTALFFQQVHLAEVKGWTHVELVALFPIYTTFTVGCGLIFGLAIDRWSSVRLIAYMPLPMALAFLLLGFADTLLIAGLGFALIGVAQAGAGTVAAAFWPEIYGTRHIGAVKALAAGFMVVGSAIGPVVTGWLIDFGVSFPDQMPGIALYILLVSVLTFWVTTHIRPHMPKISASA